MTSVKNEGDLAKVPFEEALNRTGFGLYSYILTALTGVSVISFACMVYGSTIIVQTSACELETTGAQQGLLVAAPIIGAILGAVVWGYLADTRGRKSMLMTSFLAGATINALASISVNWIMLMIMSFTAALLASGQYTIPMTILSESVPVMKRNLVLLLVTSIFMLAQGIMAVLAIPIIPLTFSYYLSALDIYWNSWRTLMVFYSSIPFICALWLFFMHESPKYVIVKGNEEEALEILRKIHRMNNRGSREELNVKGIISEHQPETKSSAKDQILPLFKSPLLKYTIIMSTLSIFLQVGGFIVWLPRIANQFVVTIQTGNGTDLTLCGIIAESDNVQSDNCNLNETALLIVFAVGGMQSFINALLSLVINKAGRRNTVIAMTAICGLSGLILNWIPNAIGSAVLFTVFLMGMVVVGLYTAISVALFPTHLRALAVSITMSGGRLMSFASIQILNALLINNCEVGFYIFSTLFASSAIVASFLPDDRIIMRKMAEQAATQSQPKLVQYRNSDTEEDL